MEECFCISIVVSLERNRKEQLNRNIYGLILHQRSLRAYVCQHFECNFTHFSMCVIFFCFECTFGDFTGCLPVCGQLLPVCCLSFLRIFVAKDKILACKMFEIKSDRWYVIFFVVEIFLIHFFSLFNCIKVSFFGNFLSFCKT